MISEKEIITTYLSDQTISLNEIKKRFNITRYKLEKIFKENNICVRKNQSSLIKIKRKWSFNTNFFLEETPHTAYFMGFCLADGSLIKSSKKSKNRKWYIKIHVRDICILEKFCDWMSLPRDHIKINGNNCIINLCHEIFDNDFSKWGIVPNKTYNPVEPKVNEEILKYFLIGLIDGDGSISYGKKTGYKFNLVCNKVITKWFETSIKNLGFQEYLTTCENTEKVWNRVRNSSRRGVLELARILNVKNCSFCLDRKWLNVKMELE